MKIFTLILLLTLHSAIDATVLAAKDTLDTLLPPPFWLRSRAEELRIDAQTRQSIEQTYQEKEPEYHKIKSGVEELTIQLHKALIADELDESLIAERMEVLLEAENKLKLYQIQVRISLLSLLTAEKRKEVRELARLKPEADWQGVLLAKVEKARQLSQRISESGQSVAEIEKRVKEIDEQIRDEKITKASRKLNQLIRDLEESLNR